MLTPSSLSRWSNKIKCKMRPAVIYIRDKEGSYWRLKKDRKLTKIKLQEYILKLLHYEGATSHSMTLLDMLASQQESIQAITDNKGERRW